MRKQRDGGERYYGRNQVEEGKREDKGEKSGRGDEGTNGGGEMLEGEII